MDPDPNSEPKKALEAVIIDLFAEILAIRFNPTLTEIAGTARSDYLRGRVDAARNKLEALRQLERRQREAERRRREIERENNRHHKPSGRG